MKKRILSIILTAAMAISLFQISYSGTLKTSAESVDVYSQDFESVSNFSALNWQKTGYSNNYATWNIVEENGNKQLVVDNLTERAKGAAAYTLVSDEDMSSIVTGSYEVKFDFTILEDDKTGALTNHTRWFAIQLNDNASRENNYTRIAFKGAGAGATFETYTDGTKTSHGAGEWFGTSYPAFTTATNPARWGMNEKVSVRIVADRQTDTIRIYLNNVLNAVSTVASFEAYDNATKVHSSIALRLGDNIKIAFDNFSVNSIDPTTVYEEDFESQASFAALGWGKTAYGNNYATWNIVEENGNKQLVVDNLTEADKGATAYTVVSDEAMKKLSKENYSLSFDLTLLDADADSRWCAIQLNNNPSAQNNYTRIAFRGAGYGAFQSVSGTNSVNHGAGEWQGVTCSAFTDQSITRWNMNEKFNVRIEVDYKTTRIRIYINDVLTAVSATNTYKVFDMAAEKFSSIALYLSDNIKIAVDNIVVTNTATEKAAETEPLKVIGEDFENKSDFSAVGWQKASFSNNFATWSIEESDGNKQLVVDNYTESGKGTSAYIIATNNQMSAIAGDNYEVNFDLTFLNTSGNSNWCAIELNFNDDDTAGTRNCTRIALRRNGNGVMETYIPGTNGGNSHGTNDDWGGMSYPQFSTTVTPNRWTTSNKFNVKIVVDYGTSTLRVYANKALVAVSNPSTWGKYVAASNVSQAISLYVSQNVAIAFDNFSVCAAECEKHGEYTSFGTTATKNNKGQSITSCVRCGHRLYASDAGDCIWDDENHTDTNAGTATTGTLLYCVNGENLAIWGNGDNTVVTAAALAEAVTPAIHNVFIRGGITEIDNNAFAGLSGVSKVYFSGNSITIGANSFSGISAKVFYPTNNKTYTASYKLSYGGNLYWQGDSYEYGDINADGTSDSSDIVLLRKSLLMDDLDIADINNDGAGNVIDFIAMVKNILG